MNSYLFYSRSFVRPISLRIDDTIFHFNFDEIYSFYRSIYSDVMFEALEYELDFIEADVVIDSPRYPLFPDDLVLPY